MGSVKWQRRLRFRDALRVNPSLAERYAHIKSYLATQHHTDRQAYTLTKTEYVLSVMGSQ